MKKLILILVTTIGISCGTVGIVDDVYSRPDSDYTVIVRSSSCRYPAYTTPYYNPSWYYTNRNYYGSVYSYYPFQYIRTYVPSPCPPRYMPTPYRPQYTPAVKPTQPTQNKPRPAVGTNTPTKGLVR